MRLRGNLQGRCGKKHVSCILTVKSGMPHFETMLLRSMIIWLLSTAYAICCTPNTSLQEQKHNQRTWNGAC
jgi:hypothetical protein